MGYNSEQVEKQNASKRNRFEEKRQLFKGAGSTLPLASTLHSYVPTIIFKEQF
jgi:hypothetical protein